MEIPFVESASETTGSIDIIVKAYVPAIDQMQELVVNQIRELEGVISTETYVVLTDRSRK
jgi:DNA-binding Lrp family transcriptional regulator